MALSKKLKKNIAVSGILFLIPGTLIILAVLTTNNFYTLPYLQLSETSELFEVETSEDALNVPAFELINQDGLAYGSDSLQGKIWLAAFFSTDSDYLWGITSQLLWINFKYRDIQDLYIVCFSLNPEVDKPEVIRAYVNQNIQYNTAQNRWQFLTGDAQILDNLIRSGFKLDPDSNPSTAWLVDQDGFMRGMYNLRDTGEVKRIIEDMALMKKEVDFDLKEE